MPSGTGVRQGIHFTTAEVHERDYLVMLNNRRLDSVGAPLELLLTARASTTLIVC
jgi:hypothetical protein